MKRTVISITIYAVCTLVSFNSYGQSSLSVSFPMIWSDVKVKDNWTPPTAPNYKEYREGSAFGYGINLSYSIQPGFIIKNKQFSINIGAGYFKQRFDVVRPFNYNSPLYLIFYTDHYSYHSLMGALGLKYHRAIGKKYLLSGSLTYTILQSFRQEYTPYHNSGGTKFPDQIDKSSIDFGKMCSISVGLDKQLGDRFSAGIQLLFPFYTRWRNDEIFDDDPLTFSRPDFSLGSVITIAYVLKKSQK
jgi:hypothetical protein